MKITKLIRRLAAWQAAAVLTFAGGAAYAYTPFESSNNDSDILGVAHATDPLLVNPWGLTTGTEGNVHVSDNATGVSTLYGRYGAVYSGTAPGQSAIITIPLSEADTSGTVGAPSGIDANIYGTVQTSATDFPITSGPVTASSHFIFCTEDGAIEGYRADLSASNAIIASDQSENGAGYTGIALTWQYVPTVSGTTLEHRLYAANFRQGIVQEFDNQFNLLTLSGSETFTDPSPPPIPAGAPEGATWSPFNIHRLDFHESGPSATGTSHIQRRLVVVYALHTPGLPMNDVPGAGYGYANIFQPDGAFDRRLVGAGGKLDSPWGIAISHSNLGKFKAPVIVFIGNHGDGQINGYSYVPGDPDLTGVHLGTMMNDLGLPLAFDGLWALHFGPKKFDVKAFLSTLADLGEDPANLYFSAGIAGETHGLVGRIMLKP